MTYPARLRRLALAATIAAALSVPMVASADEDTVSTPTTTEGGRLTCPDSWRWATLAQRRGVTVCQSLPAPTNVYVQIVDLTSGAKLRVMSQPAAGTVLGGPSTQFEQKTAKEWFWWSKANVTTPAEWLLVSASNGSFLRDYDGTTALSFPEKKWGQVLSTGEDFGVKKKRVLGFNDPRGGGIQSAHIAEWSTPPSGLADFSYVTNRLSLYFDATVGFHPTEEGNAAEKTRRTYVGVASPNGCYSCWQSRVYVLNSNYGLTLQEARDILVRDFGAMTTIQLDGGGSTQLSWMGNEIIKSNDPLRNRPVPEALLVYEAP